jgi:hypothetical protein
MLALSAWDLTAESPISRNRLRTVVAGMNGAGALIAALTLVPRQATFARLMSSVPRMTLRSVGSVTWRFRKAM